MLRELEYPYSDVIFAFFLTSHSFPSQEICQEPALLCKTVMASDTLRGGGGGGVAICSLSSALPCLGSFSLRFSRLVLSCRT